MLDSNSNSNSSSKKCKIGLTDSLNRTILVGHSIKIIVFIVEKRWDNWRKNIEL